MEELDAIFEIMGLLKLIDDACDKICNHSTAALGANIAAAQRNTETIRHDAEMKRRKSFLAANHS